MHCSKEVLFILVYELLGHVQHNIMYVFISWAKSNMTQT